MNQDFLLSINDGFKKHVYSNNITFFSKYLLFRIICEKYDDKKKTGNNIVYIETFNYILMEILLSASIITGMLLY